MITIIGTGHIFRIAEHVSFIIKHLWPDAVLVELDVTRYNAMTGKPVDGTAERKKAPWIYRSTAKYQSKMASKYKADVGGELLAAVNTGKLVGAEIILIDSDAENAMADAWNEMPFGERARYTMSMFRDRIGGRRNVERTQSDYSDNEAVYLESLRSRYPVLMRNLIDDRDEHMYGQIAEASKTHDNMVVVVGDAHVEGIVSRIGDSDTVMKIRLKDLLDTDRLGEIKSKIWNGEDNQ
jgi:pheromone shutdown protein TraB